MFLRQHWFGLSFLLVCGVIVSLFFLLQPTPKAPIVIYKPVEPLEKPTAEAPVGDTSQGGHFHADGTWHDQPHDPLVEQPTVQRPQPQGEAPRHAPVAVSQRRTLPEEILSPEYIAMVKKAVQTSIATRGKRDENGLALPEYVDARNLVTEARGDAHSFLQIYYDDTRNNRAYLEKYERIIALDDPYMALVPKPKLNSEELSQLRKAADEFDALQPKNPIESLPNPYRERLQEEENR
jgi:hypothetical protein